MEPNNKTQHAISIIVPALNEEQNLEPLMLRIQQSLALFDIDYEVIVIDDRSTDRTFEKAEELGRSYPVRIFEKRGERGKAFSLLEGFEYAKYDLLAILDADLQYPPEALREMLEKINDGADVVIANRVSQDTTIVRKIFSKTFAFVFARLLHGLKCDVQSGLKLFKKEVVANAQLNPTPWTFDMEFLLMAKRRGFEIKTVDIQFAARQNGESKIKLFQSMFEIGSNAVALKFKIRKPESIAPSIEHTMIGSGVSHNGNRFITHSTLPHEISAIQTFTRWQKIFLGSAVCVLLLGLTLSPLRTGIAIMAVLSAIYFIDTVFNFYLMSRSLKKSPEISISEENLRTLSDSDLPMYTILCPLYKEANVIPQFLAAMDKLDWPHDKLEVLLLLEENDQETIQVARNHNLPSYVHVLVVPHSMPKTKPKACNFGLSHAHGEYLVIYDAEDVPEPSQLKKAYLGFQTAGATTACLQGKLNYYNPRQNLLTRLFTAEYSLWFDLVLPALQSINTYIPLGGTSNHFRTAILRTLEGWDPFNVTEDCDLGIRLFRQGYKTAIIDSVTLEEANSNVKNWLRQRSRWIKGYMQTYLVHMRKPVAFSRSNGIHAIIFQLTVGCKIAFTLINPLLWLATILYFTMKSVFGPTIEALFPPFVFFMAAISLVFGNFMFFYLYMIGCAKRGHWSLMKYVYLIPLYWLATSISSYIALYQLFVKPHYWEKTRHGLHVPEAQPVTEQLQPSYNVRAEEVLAQIESIPAVSIQADISVAPVPVFEPLPVPRPVQLAYAAAESIEIAQVEEPSPSFFARMRLNMLPRDWSVFLQSGGVLVIAMLVSNVVNLIFNAVLGRILSFEELGLLSFITTLWYVASVFINALSATVTHKVAYLTARKRMPSTARFTDAVLHRSIIISLLLSLAWVLAAPMMSRFFHISDVGALLLFTPIFSFGVTLSVHRGFLNGGLHFRSVAALYIFEAVSKISIALFLIGTGLTDFVYLSIPGSIIVTGFFALWLIRAYKKDDETSSRKVEPFPSRFYVASLFSALSAIIFLSVDMILVKHYMSPEIAGEYALLSLVGKMVYFLGILPNTFMIPLVSRDLGLKKSSRKTLQILFTSTLTLVSISIISLGLFGWLLIPALLGDKAVAIVPYLVPYVVAIGLFTLSTVIVSYHLAKRQFTFPIASLGLAALMAIGIMRYHDSLSSIIHVIFSVGGVSLVVMAALHSLEKRYPFVVSNALDFLDIFSRTDDVQHVTTGDRILIFNWRDTQHVFAGGAEVYIHEMARKWVAEGHLVTVFCGNDGMSARAETIDGVRIIRRGGFYMVYFWAIVYYLLKFRGRYDIIIDGHNGIPFFTPLYSRKPVFCLMHHVHQEVFRRSLSKPLALFAQFLEKRLMPLVYRNVPFITVSESSKQEIAALGLGQVGIDIVSPGVDLSALRPGKKNPTPLILYLGRLKAYKSINILLDAFVHILVEEPNTELVVAGSGEEQKNLQAYAAQLGIADHVHFMGKIDETLKLNLLQRAWVLVNPSFMEGWGITTIEANACATPVVASNVPGLRDSVLHLQTGYLAEYGNSEEFASKVLAIFNNAALRQSMMHKAVIWANSFDWDSKSEKFFSIMKNGLSVRRSNGGLTLRSLFVLTVIGSLLVVGIGYGIAFNRVLWPATQKTQPTTQSKQQGAEPPAQGAPDWLAIKKQTQPQEEPVPVTARPGAVSKIQRSINEALRQLYE